MYSLVNHHHHRPTHLDVLRVAHSPSIGVLVGLGHPSGCSKSGPFTIYRCFGWAGAMEAVPAAKHGWRPTTIQAEEVDGWMRSNECGMLPLSCLRQVLALRLLQTHTHKWLLCTVCQ